MIEQKELHRMNMQVLGFLKGLGQRHQVSHQARRVEGLCRREYDTQRPEAEELRVARVLDVSSEMIGD
ncbi:hypothetical protein [Microvirga ossetica]|uniref:hypothetical protein n=1 Tax=Microvirga ossetica TaxID=1882682 RepID=UPI00130000E2|nr:hypothetical protein [Microvirga ossetica]